MVEDTLHSPLDMPVPGAWCRVGPHIVTNFHCIAQLAADRTNTQVSPCSFCRSDLI